NHGYAGGKQIDMLLNISNDGWFSHSSELEMHLAASVFRAVENRIAVARAVNTGASALIDPSGRIHNRVELSPEKRARLPAVRTALVRLREKVQNAMEMRAIAAGLAEVQVAVENIGREFRFVPQRLEELFARGSSGEGSTSAASHRALLDQIDEDIEAVDR